MNIIIEKNINEHSYLMSPELMVEPSKSSIQSGNPIIN